MSVLSQQVSALSQSLSSQAAALSVRIDTQSQGISVLSQQVSVLSQLHSTLSQAVSVLSQKVSAVGAWFVRGLSALVSGTSTVNMAADAAGFWASVDNSIHTIISVAAVTNNIGLSAGVDNGRDQAAVFGASNWIHFYFVLDGTTVKTRSSLTGPPTGPALQGTERAWAYAGAVRYNASALLLLVRMRDSWTWYELDDGGANRVLTAGQATTFTTVDLSGLIPPNTRHFRVNSLLLLRHNLADVRFEAHLRPTGSGLTVGALITLTRTQVADVAVEGVNEFVFVPGTSDDVDYVINAAPSTSGGLYLDVTGYQVPNGGE